MITFKKLDGTEVREGFIGYVKVRTVECIPETEFYTLVKVMLVISPTAIRVVPIVSEGRFDAPVFCVREIWVTKEL